MREMRSVFKLLPADEGQKQPSQEEKKGGGGEILSFHLSD